MSDETKPVGRPSDFRDEYIAEAESLCVLGATDAELAEHFGCATSTLYEWKNRYPEFSEAIKRGKTPADTQVAGALFQRATGAEWVEQQAIKCKRVTYMDGKRVEDERVEIVEVTRRAPPDTTAGIFWLKNRRPQHWRDRQELTGKDGAPLVSSPFDDLSAEELEAVQVMLAAARTERA